MQSDTLARFIGAVRSGWGPITTSLVDRCRSELDILTSSNENEDWLSHLLVERPTARELHREPNGFMLLAHAEQQGLYRPPHDHGDAWVVYGVQSGALEVNSYVRVGDIRGERLVRRDTHILKPGTARAYLPGDIHDTRCLTQQALVFRFTERDLKVEDHVRHRITRFIERDGQWFAPTE